jgi:hypothetical protein
MAMCIGNGVSFTTDVEINNKWVGQQAFFD